MVREVRGEVNTIVGDTRLFTKYGNVELAGVSFIEEILNKAMAYHPITDYSQFDFAHFCLDFYSITAYLNDSANPLLDIDQFRPHIPLNGYILDFCRFF